MSKKSIAAKSATNVSKLRKSAEYQAFIKSVGTGKISANWESMAGALGVHPNTISKWKKLPEFQKALAQGIEESFNRMTTVGKRDWRMWRERHAMLAKEENKNNTTVNVSVPVFNVISNESKENLEKLYSVTKKDD